MALTNAYASVAEVRDQFADSGSKLDLDLLEKAINAASRSIDKLTGRRFWPDATVKVRTYQPDDPYVAWVDDISTTTGLIIKTDTTGDDTYATTWDTADYKLEPRNADKGDAAYTWWRIVAVDDKTFPVDELRDTLQVTAKFGWSAVPDEVNEACILKAVSLFKRKDAPFGVAGFGEFGAVRISRRDHDVYELLHPYIRYSVGAL